MFPALLALVPTKDWFIGAAFAVLAVMGWHYYEKYHEAVTYAATVKAESAAALQLAQQQVKDLTAQYDSTLKTQEAAYETALNAASAQHTADVDRLRNIATARNGDPVLQGASGTAAEAAAWAKRLGRLESVSVGLADALRQDDDALKLCYAERDALTGK